MDASLRAVQGNPDTINPDKHQGPKNYKDAMSQPDNMDECLGFKERQVFTTGALPKDVKSLRQRVLITKSKMVY
jgi:hypothetical protein